MKKIVPIAMRVLDNVIDLNFYPIKEAENTSKKYRSV
jgi:ribonucleoside-diphosphate reductase alpha chain